MGIGQTLQSGHYTATCARWSSASSSSKSTKIAKPKDNGVTTAPTMESSWVHFDDKSVQKASSQRVKTYSSYILVYQCQTYIGLGTSASVKPDIAGICSD